MSPQELDWTNAKRYHIEEFAPFRLANGLIWAPAYIKNKWRILELTPQTTLQGVGYALTITGGGGRVLPFVRGAFRRTEARS